MIEKHEISVIMRAVGRVVREYVSEAISRAWAEMGARIKAIPSGPKGDRGDKGDPGINGKDGDPAILRSMIDEEVTRSVSLIPIPVDGKDGAPGQKGDKGDPGENGKDVDPVVVRSMIGEEVDRAMRLIKLEAERRCDEVMSEFVSSLDK